MASAKPSGVGSRTGPDVEARASAARLGLGSAMTTVEAPSASAYSADSIPIGPAPVMSTMSPPRTPTRSMPYAATLAGSTTAPSRSETSSGRVGDLVVLEHGVLGEAAGLGAEPGTGELHAEVAEPAPAVVAAAADDGRHDRDPVADARRP